ncbi:MAG: cob(I)yrinic acid a,c-diamide adenosyltransferase [Promethearchaeota archaeon]
MRQPRSEKRLKEGFVHVYTGDGKGKTTTAFGLAMRAIGHGYSVNIIQYLKGEYEYGEVKASKYLPNLEVKRFGTLDFVNPEEKSDTDVEQARKAFDYSREVVMSEKWDIVILDEINVALDFGLFKIEEVLDLIEKKPKKVELILTGRYAPSQIVRAGDIVTYMRQVKHVFSRGIGPREGVDY